MLNHLNRTNKFKSRGSHCSSGHMQHVVCFLCSACEAENRICHSGSFIASTIKNTVSFRTLKINRYCAVSGLILPHKSLFFIIPFKMMWSG